MRPRNYRPASDVFSEDAFIMDENGCWRWQGRLNYKGYGRVGSHGSAHRMYYEKYKGPVPSGMFVLHTCDVKDCVNPEHLYAGTHADNMRDVRDRKRMYSEAAIAARLVASKASAEVTRGIPLSEETKEKLRAANLGKKASLETRLKMCMSHLGKSRSNY